MNSNDTVQTTRRPLLPPAYFLMAIVVMVALHFLAPVGRWIDWPWTLIGVAPIVAGLAIAMQGSRQFRQADTTIYPFETSSLLVTDGVFRWSRNPMYLGMMSVLTGIVIGLGSLTPIVVLPLFFGIIRQRFILREERSLAQQFGPTYHEYAQRVRRWI